MTPRELSLFLVCAVTGLLSALSCTDVRNETRPPVCDHGPGQRLPIPGAGCEAGPPPAGYPSLTAACDFGPTAASALVVTTTDFSTGAVSLVDLAKREVSRDVALGSTDAIPMAHDGLVYVIHRLGLDYIDALDPNEAFRSLREVAVVASDGRGLNPYDLDFRSDGLAFVSVFDGASIEVLDLTCDAALRTVGRVDLSAFADADGKPEQIFSIRCGDTLFVAAQRLDSATYASVDTDVLIAVDMNRCQTHDLDPGRDGSEAIEFLGSGPKQYRRDPLDPTGHTALVLTSGVERVDLERGSISWAVAPTVFEGMGLDPWNLLDFDVAADGAYLYVAAWTSDFSGVNVWGVTPDSNAEPVLLIEELFGAEKTLHVFGDDLWIGDTTPGSAGMKLYDLNVMPPSLVQTLDTGLPPYRAVAIP